MMKPVVKIGCSAVLSREEDEAIHGRHISQAVALAVEQANQRGNLPFTVEMALGDDQAQVEAAVEVAQKFINDPQVLGVVGTMNSHTSLATAPLYQQANLTQISPAASNPTLTQQGYRTFFRVVPHDLHQGQEGAKFAVSVLGARRVAIIHDGGNFGEPLAQIFSRTCRKLGAEVSITCQIEPGKIDYSNAVAVIALANPDLIFMGVIEAEGRHLAAQLRQAGVMAPLLGTDGLKPSHFLATPAYNAEGPYHTSASTDVERDPSAAKFADAYARRYGQLYSIYTAEAYDAANLLIAACARAARLNRTSVLEQVSQIKDFAGASGLINFDQHGDRLHPRIGIYKINNGQLEFLGFTSELLAQTV